MSRIDLFNHPGLLSPRYWLLWIGLGFSWCLSRFPFGFQLWIGKQLGKLMLPLSKSRRHIAKTNIKLCFPHYSEQEVNQLLFQHFESLGISIIEFGLAWWHTGEKLEKLVTIEGEKHIEDALEKGQGVILMVMHTTMMELLGSLVLTKIPFHLTYRIHKNPLMEKVMLWTRGRKCLSLVPHTSVRRMLRILKDNEILWYAADQNFAGKNSLFIPFFGIPAATMTATTLIAKKSGATVIPVHSLRLPGNKGYKVTFQPPLEGYPSEDIEKDTRRLNETIEEGIRPAPEQYLWVHRRFKSRPNNTKSPY